VRKLTDDDDICAMRAHGRGKKCIRLAFAGSAPEACHELLGPQGAGRLSGHRGNIGAERHGRTCGGANSVAGAAAAYDRGYHQEKPDVGKLAKLAAEADATPPKNAARLAEFFYDRAQARAALGRTREATADAEAAIKAAQGGDYVDEVSRYENYLIRLLRTTGEQRRAIELLNGQIRNFESKNRGRLFNLNLMMTLSYLNLGDVPRAESYV
jgi:hypothetical protein